MSAALAPFVTAPRMRHANRIRTRDNQMLVMQRRAEDGQTVIWSERAVPISVVRS